MSETRVDWKKHLLETATLVGAAVLIALVSNALNARERKLALVGKYEAARRVPARTEAPTPEAAPTAPVATPPTTVVEVLPTAVPGVKPSAKGTAPTTAPRPAAAAAPTPAPATAAATASRPAEKADVAKRFPPSNDLVLRFPPHKDTPYVELHGDDVMALHRAGALFLDARRTNVYAEGHIANARSVPVWEADVDERVGGLLTEGRDMKAPVVIYCSGGDCEDSHMLAQKLFGGGFENLYVYREGWPDWQKRGGPSRTGETP